ncbi:hypothetical protein LMG28727_07719 [Paraburkholderia kirstenboschensis]|nr:hypothetical protein LMG28727_07719 [Paraburkholderia kirstenboschensis]
MPLENALTPELVDGCRGYVELLGHLLAGEHTALAQSVKPALQCVGLANEDDLLHGEGLSTPIPMVKFVQACCDLPVRRSLQQPVDKGNDFGPCLAHPGHRLWPFHGQALCTSAAPTYMNIDLLTDGERHVFDEQSEHALALDGARVFLVPYAREVGSQRHDASACGLVQERTVGLPLALMLTLQRIKLT